jgi:hypothetical protein
LAPSVLNTSSQGTGELLIAVADEEAYGCLRIVTVEGEVSRLLGDEGAAGFVVAPVTCTLRVPISMKNST